MCWSWSKHWSTVSPTAYLSISEILPRCRAILHGVGAMDDPDKIDNYNKACAFPIAYSADNDPEVLNEMRIAATELKEGDSDKDDNEHKISSDESSDELDKDEWEEDEDGSGGRLKKKKFSSIDKVCMVINLSGKDHGYCYMRITRRQ